MPEAAAAVTRAFLVTLVAVTSTGPLAMQLFVPGLPAIANEFEVSQGVANLALSLSFLSIGVATLFYGPLADRFGRRPVLLAGLGLFLVGTAISAFAPSAEILIGGRILQAGGSAAGLVVSRALVRDIFGPERAASVIAYLTLAMVVAPMMALILGGFIVDFWGWRWTFAFSLAFGVVVIAAVLKTVPETNPGAVSQGPAAMLVNYGRLLRSPAFTGYALNAGLTAGTFFAFMAAAPVLMIQVMQRPAVEFGLYFSLVSVAYMGASFAAGRYSERIGIPRMVVGGAAFAVVSAVAGAVWLVVGGLNPLALFVTATLVALGNGISIPNAHAGAINTAPQLAGTASAGTAFLTMFSGFLFAQGVAEFADGTVVPVLVAMVGGSIGALVAGLVPVLVRARAVAAPAAGE